MNQGGFQEEDPRRRILGGGSQEEDPSRRIPGGGSQEEDPKRRIPGGESQEEDTRRRRSPEGEEDTRRSILGTVGSQDKCPSPEGEPETGEPFSIFF